MHVQCVCSAYAITTNICRPITLQLILQVASYTCCMVYGGLKGLKFGSKYDLLPCAKQVNCEHDLQH